MRKVWKYRLGRPDALVAIPMPPDAEVVHFASQNGDLTMWVLLDPSYALDDYKARHFIMLGTGWDVPDGLKYLKTTQEVPYVWHLFEQVNALSESV